MVKEPKRVAVLMGGLSAEREISFRSGRAVARALRRLGYEVVAVNADRRLAEKLRRLKPDAVFNVLHGTYGEDGCVQGLLEVVGVPYTGSGHVASAIGMDKDLSKRIWRARGLPTPPWTVVEKSHGAGGVRLPCELPVVVKPNGGGSSIGVSIVRRRQELEEALATARRYDDRVILEKYVPGREVTVGILGAKPLGAMQVIPKGEFHTYEVKYTKGMEEFILPAPLPAAVYQGVMRLALAAHASIGCEGVSRVDLRVTERGRAFLIEVNTSPGMTELSWLPKIAEHAGIGYDELCERILKLARLKVRETTL